MKGLDQDRYSKKVCIDANTFYADSFKLARMIWDDNYRPELIVALWRGGTPAGCVVTEFFSYKGHKHYNIALKAQSYDEKLENNKDVMFDGLEMLLDKLEPKTKVLVIDDVWDTGKTMVNFLNYIDVKTLGKISESNIKIGTVYFKPGFNEASRGPDYYVVADDSWLVLPHELVNNSKEIIKQKGMHAYESLFE